MAIIGGPLLYGGVTTLGSNATRLSDEDTPMCHLVVRSAAGTKIIYLGNADVAPSTAVGYINAGEAFTWGPYARGGGVRPSQVFIYGSPGDTVFWQGFPG